MIGVNYELFWTLSPPKLEPFIEAFKQKQIAKRDEMNLNAWLNGAYVANAISACFGKNSQYPSEPMALGGRDKDKEINNEVQRFDAFVIQYNTEYEKKNVSED